MKSSSIKKIGSTRKVERDSFWSYFLWLERRRKQIQTIASSRSGITRKTVVDKEQIRNSRAGVKTQTHVSQNNWVRINGIIIILKNWGKVDWLFITLMLATRFPKSPSCNRGLDFEVDDRGILFNQIFYIFNKLIVRVINTIMHFNKRILSPGWFRKETKVTIATDRNNLIMYVVFRRQYCKILKNPINSVESTYHPNRRLKINLCDS